MFLIFSLLLGHAFAMEDEAAICRRLLENSAATGRVFEVAYAGVPSAADSGGFDVSGVIINMVSVPGAGAIYAVDTAWAPVSGGKPERRVHFVRDYGDGGMDYLPEYGADSAEYVFRHEAIAVAALAARDVLPRPYRPGPVFSTSPDTTIVAVFDDERHDDDGSVPYLVRIENGRVTVINDNADFGDPSLKLQLISHLMRHLVSKFPWRDTIEVKATHAHWRTIVARVKSLDTSGRPHLHWYEVHRGDDRIEVTEVDRNDPRLLRTP